MNVQKTLAALAATLLLVACGGQQKPADSYTLTGTIEGLPDGTQISLIPVSHYDEPSMGDTIVTGGTFVLTGQAPEPRAVTLQINKQYTGQRFMLENGAAIRLTANAVTRPGRDGAEAGYRLQDFKVTGSPATDKYNELLSARDTLDAIYAANNRRFADFQKKMGEARGAKDAKLLKELQASDEYKAMTQADKEFFATIAKVYGKVIEENADTFWGPLMIISFTSYLTPGDTTMYAKLTPEIRQSYYGKKVHDEIFPAGAIGSDATAFTVKDDSGKSYTLPELSKGKKYIMLDFWASWCNPCRKEIPNLKEQYKKYAAKGFEIISISIDKSETEWRKALKEENLPWPNFLDLTGVAGIYKVNMIPTTYLFDGNGKVVAQNLRGNELGEKLKELLK